MRKLGFIVNPVAGIGGKVGLKGSDGAETQARARALGAVAESGKKALLALEGLGEYRDKLEVYTYPGERGEEVCAAAGLEYRVLGQIEAGQTGPEDTRRAARVLRDAGVELLLFAGGDGTARDILDAVGSSIPVLGIPTGCKIHSGVYALNPRSAGRLLIRFAQGQLRDTREAEVMDIDEALFRQGQVQARLYGYLRIPNEGRLLQNLKSGRAHSESASVDMLSNYIAETMEPDVLYIIGTGSTTAAIMEKLGLPNTLLGVDLVYAGQRIAADCTEQEILSQLEGRPKAKIIVTVIGGQGYLFGRGNQQISAEVIRRVGRENIIVAAARDKLLSLFGAPLYVDTGDEEVNALLRGYIPVIVGYEDSVMMRVSDGASDS